MDENEKTSNAQEEVISEVPNDTIKVDAVEENSAVHAEEPAVEESNEEVPAEQEHTSFDESLEADA